MVTKANVKAVYGHTTESFGADPSDLDKSYEFRYKVLSLDDVITSHTENMGPNPDYPKELQPRIRDRAASRVQVDRMAANLNPRALLHDTGFLDTGPMIVGSDNVVESGNGRTIALRKTIEDHPDKYELYKGMLSKMAERYGISQTEIAGIDKPVLVRERITPVDRVAFTAEANIGAVMSMSPHEQALQDAGRLSDTVIQTLEVGEDQSIDEALRVRKNAHIVSHFMKMIPANEKATVSDAKGKVNQAGILRLKMAIFAKTYSGDAGERLTRTFSESLDPEVKSLENSMFQSLPDMAKAESLIASGQRDAGLSIAPDLAEVVETIAGLKQTGVTVADYLKQAEMFGARLTPLQRRILAHLRDIGRSSKKSRTFLREIAQSITDAPISGQVSFMGIEAPTKGDIVNGIIDRQRTEYGLPAIPSTATVPTDKERLEPVTGGVEDTRGLGTGIQRGRSTPEVVIAARTSVQPGLMGIGPEGVQVEAFGEWGTAPGAGGEKVLLVDVEAIKAAEKTKPLPGQIGLEEKQPWQMTQKEWVTSETGAFGWGRKVSARLVAKQASSFHPSQKALKEAANFWDMSIADARRSLDYFNYGMGQHEVPNIKFAPYHKKIVKQALSEGKPVPPEVLADYPDLKDPTEVGTYPKIPKARVKELKNHEELVLQAIIKKPGITLPELEQAVKLQPVQIDGAIRRLGEGIVVKTEGKMTPGGLTPSSYNLTSEAAPTEAPKRKRKAKPKADKRLLKSEILEIQEGRSELSQSSDLAREHSIVVPVTSQRTRAWVRDQGSMDIQGIDTPRKKRTKKIRKTTRKQRPHTSMGGLR